MTTEDPTTGVPQSYQGAHAAPQTAPPDSYSGFAAPQPPFSEAPAANADNPAPVEEPLDEKVGADVASLAPEAGRYKLTNGTVVLINPLKTRELFKFLKILTRGAGPLLLNFNLASDNAGEFAQRLTVLAVMSIPEAEDEAMEFLQFICKPEGLIERSQLTKDDQNRNNELWQNMFVALGNPEIEDTIGIVTSMILAEKDNIFALVKKIQAMLATLGVDLTN